MKTFLQKMMYFNKHQNVYNLVFRQDLSEPEKHDWAVECTELATGEKKILLIRTAYLTLNRINMRMHGRPYYVRRAYNYVENNQH